MAIATQPTSLTAEILQLSVAERIALANAIWDSVVDENQPIQLTEAQKRELDRRLDKLENDPRPGKSWEQLKAELMSR